MSEQSPASGPITDGPADPEHDASAAYGLDRSYVAGLTRRLVSTSGETAAVSSPIGRTPLAHVPQSSPADVAEAFARARRAQGPGPPPPSTSVPTPCCGSTTWCSTARTS